VTLPTALRRRIVSPDPETTRLVAAALARAARPGDLICLRGDLGAGKTQFAKGFAEGLGVEATVNSPSFVLMAEYEGRLPLFHLDLYRLVDAADVVAGGLLDERQETGATLIEWPERMAAALPEGRLEVVFTGTGEDPRVLDIRAASPAYLRYLEALG